MPANAEIELKPDRGASDEELGLDQRQIDPKTQRQQNGHEPHIVVERGPGHHPVLAREAGAGGKCGQIGFKLAKPNLGPLGHAACAAGGKLDERQVLRIARGNGPERIGGRKGLASHRDGWHPGRRFRGQRSGGILHQHARREHRENRVHPRLREVRAHPSGKRWQNAERRPDHPRGQYRRDLLVARLQPRVLPGRRCPPPPQQAPGPRRKLAPRDLRAASPCPWARSDR